MRLSSICLTIVPHSTVIPQDAARNTQIKKYRGKFMALRVLAFLFGVLLIPGSVFGQSAQITGRVVDATGAVVVGAKVAVANTETGIERALSTNNDGYYTAPSLTRGSYKVTVSQTGFKSAVRSGLTLDEGGILKIDFALEIGQVTQEIQVSSAAPLLETETAQLSTVVQSQRIADMPTSGRNPLQFALFVPGVRGLGAYGALAVSAYSGGRASIAGGAVSSNNYMVDGIASENPTSGSMQTPLTVDATEEFRLITRNAPAEYGRTGGGIMNLISKSGTNDFRGNLYEFNQNTILRANNYFSKLVNSPRQPYHFNLWGGTVGGPIKKEKSFFFFNYEQYSQRTLATTTRTVPTDLQRSGDFSQTYTSSGTLVKIYDPATLQVDPSNPGSYLRAQFPGNVIPAARISSVAKAIAAYFPEPNTTGVAGSNANNFFGVAASPLDGKTLGLRLDQYLSSTRRLAGRYTWQSVGQGIPNFFNNIAEPQNSFTPFHRHSGFASYSDALRPTLLVDLRAGLNLYLVNRVTRSYGFDLSKLGMPASLNSEIQVPSFPAVTNSDVSQIGMQASSDQLMQSGKAYSYVGSLIWIRGRSTWKFGSENRVYQFNNTQPNQNMSLGFSRGFTQGPNPNTSGAATGYGYASFLLGIPSSGSIGYGRPSTETEKNEALYVQDDWKVTPNLTVNLGFRWEYEGGITDRFNAISNFDPKVVSSINGMTLTGGLAFPGVGGLNRGHRDAEWTDFQPRLGFSWQVIPKTVLRAGAGLFYLPSTGNTVGLNSSGFSTSLALVSSLDGFTPNVTLANPFPTALAAPTGSSQGALTQLGQGISGNTRNLSRGYSTQWSMSIQRELPGNWLVEIGYMGNRGVHLQGSRSFDYLPSKYLSLGTQLQQQVTNPFYGTIASTLALGKATVTQSALLNTYPQFAGASGIATMADSIYHAGTLRVERRFTNGLAVLVSFTDSKLIDNNSGNGNNGFNDTGSEGVRDWGNLSLERSVSAENLPRTLVMTASYELPFGKSGNALYRKAVGGWQLNGIGTINTGSTIGVGQNSPAYGSGFPNLVGDPSKSNPSVSMWLNKAAFSDAPIFTLGNAPRNLPHTRTAAWRGLDLSLMKTFSVYERFKLQCRGEAFNFTNTPVFGNPNTNIDSSSFGTITGLAPNNNPRNVQIALKLLF